MNRFTNPTGGKAYLFSIIFDIAMQIAFSIVLSAVVIVGGYGSAAELPRYSTWNIVAMFFLQGAFVAAIFVTKPRLTAPAKKSAAGWCKDVLLSVLTAAVCLCCFSWMGEWFALALEAIGYNGAVININGTLDLVLCLIVTVLVAPVVEETVFRNALTNEFRRRHGLIVTVLLSGICFALMHMSPQQTVYQFMLGCACAYTFLRTENVVVPSLIHALSNAVAIGLNYVDWSIIKPPEGQSSVLLNNPALSVPITLLLAVAGVAIIFFAGKAAGEKQPAFEYEFDRESGGKASCITALVICGVMWTFSLIGGIAGL